MEPTNNNNIQSRQWEKIVRIYSRPDIKKSIGQIANSFLPYAALWYLMYLSLQLPYWVTLLLALPAAGFIVRLFIIFHDCGHGSFFKSKKTNDIVGKIMGILVFTPYSPWHFSHRIHHSTAGNLDKRGEGDVWTLTVEEYMASSKMEKLYYRLYRNPWIMFTVGALLMLLVKNRFTKKRMTKSDKRNIYFTNIMLLLITGGLCFLIGVKAFLLIQIPIILIAFSTGIWLFYVQHQFDDVYWDKGEQWDYKEAAMEGSSFFKLPIILQWFTGNIGFHHIHHLSPRIPNYNLARCHYENEMFAHIKPITLKGSFKTLSLRLLDDVSGKMITFRQLMESNQALASTK
jgi:omega-6 fatty acid desaturase (delta-12 desaturase)